MPHLVTGRTPFPAHDLRVMRTAASDGLAGRPGDESRLHKECYVCSDTGTAIMSRRNAAILASGVTSNGTLLIGTHFLEGAALASSDPVGSVPRGAIGERGETRWT
jgi:hypothetical protein